MARSALLNVMVQAALKAGKSLARDFGEVQNLQVSLKGPGDYRHQADRKAEKMIREELLKARPTYGFLGEESEEINGTDGAHRWIVDPLDGTTNFLHGIPHVLRSRSRWSARAKSSPASSSIRRPTSSTPPSAAVAPSSTTAACVSPRARICRMPSSAAAFRISGAAITAPILVELRHVMGEVAGVRRVGSAALDLAYVAAGRFDGFWERGLLPWDMAAGILLIREAGGLVADIDGGNECSMDEARSSAAMNISARRCRRAATADARQIRIVFRNYSAAKRLLQPVDVARVSPSIRHKVPLVSASANIRRLSVRMENRREPWRNWNCRRWMSSE